MKRMVYRVVDERGRFWDGTIPGDFGTYPFEFTTRGALERDLRKYFIYHSTRVKKVRPVNLTIVTVDYVPSEVERKSVAPSEKELIHGLLLRKRSGVPHYVLDDAKDVERWEYLVSASDAKLESPDIRQLRNLYSRPSWYAAYNFGGLFYLKSKTSVKQVFDIKAIIKTYGLRCCIAA